MTQGSRIRVLCVEAVALCFLSTSIACDDAPPSPDGGVDVDAGLVDAGPAIDAGPLDGGPVDAVPSDGGLSHTALCAEEPDDGDPVRFYDRNLLRFAAPADAGVEVQLTLTRLPVDWVGESSVYALQRMTVDSEDGVVCVTDAEALRYENSHHNFADDAAVVIDGETHLLQMRISWDEITGEREWTDTYSVSNAAGDVLVGPLRLFENSGAVLR